jgi:chemotaxis family two-component system sensor kinase Cph1
MKIKTKKQLIDELVELRQKIYRLEKLEIQRKQAEIALKESGAIITHDDLPTVMADSSQLIRLLQNLISNAIKFRSQETPRIHISAKQKEDEWVFSFKDNGIGIEPKFSDQIFVMFQRLHTRQEYPGTGIGLATCKKIIERHGGRIWVESEFGKGSTFFFSIPTRGKT